MSYSRNNFGLCVLVLFCLLSMAGVGRGELLFKDNFNTSQPTDDIQPDPLGNDETGRQTGSLAHLSYIQDADWEFGGARENMTQLNNPDFFDALLLAPSQDFNFEHSVYVKPDHNFVEDPGAGNMMVISYDANPVHDSKGVQVTDEAPIRIRFAHGLEFLLYDGGNFEFYKPGFGILGSDDLEPMDAGESGGLFSGFHNVRIHLITEAWDTGNSLDVSIYVDDVLVEIDTDATPTLFETTVQTLPPGGDPENFITLTGHSDPDAPGKVAGLTVFTLHGIDNFAVSIAPIPEPATLGLLLLGGLALLRRRK